MKGVRCHGIVLVVVMVVVVMLSLAAYTFAELMLSEFRAAQVNLRQAQARALSDSGVEYLRDFLAQSPEVAQQNGGRYNNSAVLQGLLLIDGTVPRDRGRFTVLSPNVEDGELNGVRFGVQDESARLNLNALAAIEKAAAGSGRGLLLAIPGMTDETADSILDWLDEDDETREQGAEIDYYSGVGYKCKNGPLDTIEELLLVKGITPDLLFGADYNRNGVVDPNEQTGSSLAEATSSPSEANLGWAQFLTLYSLEENVQPDGTPRIDLNGNDMQVLYDELSAVLSPEQANFIVAYRQFGPYTGNEQGQSSAAVELDYKQAPKTQLTNVLDLVGVKVRLTPPGQNQSQGQSGQQSGGGNRDGGGGNRDGGGGGNGGNNDDEEEDEGDDEATILESPFPNEPLGMNAWLPKLLDHVTVNKSPTIAGRININQASPIVLRGIPGLDDEMVQAILANREIEPSGQKESHRHEHWLLTEGVVTLEEMKRIVPFVTASGSVFRAQVVGYFDQEGPAARVEVVINAAGASLARPRVVFWRDLSNLGRGYNLATLGTSAE
jgi:DNA uptake protein ComE-like DNA-binding protein